MPRPSVSRPTDRGVEPEYDRQSGKRAWLPVQTEDARTVPVLWVGLTWVAAGEDGGVGTGVELE